MTTRILGDLASRAAPIGGVAPYSLARALSGRESEPRRPVGFLNLGIDGAGYAAFGYSRGALDRAGGARFPL